MRANSDPTALKSKSFVNSKIACIYKSTLACIIEQRMRSVPANPINVRICTTASAKSGHYDPNLNHITEDSKWTPAQ